MVPFAGYEMPVQYPSGILQEHLHTRAQAGLFDVSHMGQVRLAGADAARALEALVPGDLLALAPRHMRYTLLLNEQGGILDDLMATRLEDALFLVVNAARKEADLADLRDRIAGAATVEPLADKALLALQGPAAATVLSRFAPAVAPLGFMTAMATTLDGRECLITRSGYTGEDGFEISLTASDAAAVALGAVGAGIVAVAILISTLGANNGIVLTAARVPYAMARDGLLFRWIGAVHPRWLTPANSLLAQAVISIALTLTGEYRWLYTYVVFAEFVFYALMCGALIRLRRRRADMARPYRAWGYPVTPILFILFSLWLVGNTIIQDPIESAITVGLIAAGVPFYLYFKRRSAAVGDRSSVVPERIPTTDNR